MLNPIHDLQIPSMALKVKWIKLEEPLFCSEFTVVNDDDEISLMYISIVTILSLYQRMECTLELSTFG